MRLPFFEVTSSLSRRLVRSLITHPLYWRCPVAGMEADSPCEAPEALCFTRMSEHSR